MVNDNLPPVANSRDSVSVEENSTYTPTTSSVDLSSRRDSDIAQTLRSQSGSTSNFLNDLTIQMDSDPTGGTNKGSDGATRAAAPNVGDWANDGPSKPNETNGNGVRKDGPYTRDVDDSKHMNDGPYDAANRPNERVTQPVIEPQNDGTKPPKGSIREQFPELFPQGSDNIPKGKNPIATDEPDQRPGKKSNWTDGPQPIGVAPIGDSPNPKSPKGGSWNAQPIGRPGTIDVPLPEPLDAPPRGLKPNDNHPPGGGGDNTGGGDGKATKPSPSSDSDIRRTTDPNDSSHASHTDRTNNPNKPASNRERKTQAIMARRHHMR